MKYSISIMRSYYLAFPLIVYAGALILLDGDWETLRVLPEWSFISIILFSEYVKDAAELRSIESSEDKEKAESSLESSRIFGVMLIVLSTMCMFAAFANQMNKIKLNIDSLWISQVSLLAIGMLMVIAMKVKVESARYNNRKHANYALPPL